MARKRHPSLTYDSCVSIFKRRVKGRNWKAIFKDCKLYDRGDHFEITHNKFVEWHHTAQGYKKITREVPLATVTKDNVLTMTYAEDVDMTACNRLTCLTGYPVGLNKHSYGNYKQHVRVYCVGDGWQTSEPYFAGMQWDVTSGGAKLLNRQPDLKIVVNNDHVTAVKREFDQLRKLTRTMVRIGAFDDFAKEYMLNRWSIKLLEYKGLDEITPTDLTGDDALAVIAFGGYNIQRPDIHAWNPQTRQYEKREAHEVMQEWLTKAMERGLKELRRKYYEKNDAYVELAA